MSNELIVCIVILILSVIVAVIVIVYICALVAITRAEGYQKNEEDMDNAIAIIKKGWESNG